MSNCILLQCSKTESQRGGSQAAVIRSGTSAGRTKCADNNVSVLYVNIVLNYSQITVVHIPNLSLYTKDFFK